MMQALSYKDPEGFVVQEHDNLFYRYVRLSYKKTYDHFTESGLYECLVKKRLLIPHVSVPLSAEESVSFYMKLLPEKIDVITYPYEWSFVQWKEVALVYLRICNIALSYGMVLRDATPFNFTFYKGNFIFFDTLSFGIYEENKPWLPYKQFCESIVGPLSLIRYRGSEWSVMMESHINGWDLSFISRLLPLRSYFNTTNLIHIHWHSRFTNEPRSGQISHTASFQKDKLSALWNMMTKDIRSWKYADRKKENWSGYYQTQVTDETYLSEKKTILAKWLSKISPVTLTDIGANTGKFSILAAAHSKKVIALETDDHCIDQMINTIQGEKIENIIPVLADITQPAPGLGWDNAERSPLLSRIKCDTILALAVVHHLRITKNVPLDLIASLFAKMTTQYAIVEFVPKSDNRVKQMLQTREDIFTDYTEEYFIQRFSLYFRLCETCCFHSSDRKLFLWEKN